MATRRISKSAIDWKKFQSLVPQNQQPQFSQLMGKSFQYAVKITSLPEELPKLDFDSYKKYVPEKAASIDKLSKAYSSVQIPYPKDVDNLLSLIDEREKKGAETIKNHLLKVDQQVESLKNKRDVISNLPPLEEMTLELSQYYFPKKQMWEKSADELVGTDPHAAMLEAKKKGHH